MVLQMHRTSTGYLHCAQSHGMRTTSATSVPEATTIHVITRSRTDDRYDTRSYCNPWNVAGDEARRLFSGEECSLFACGQLQHIVNVDRLRSTYWDQRGVMTSVVGVSWKDKGHGTSSGTMKMMAYAWCSRRWEHDSSSTLRRLTSIVRCRKP